MSKEFSVDELQTLMKSVAENQIGELLFENETLKVRIRGRRVEQTVVQMDGPTAIPVYDGEPAPLEERRADITTVPAGEGKCITSPLVGTYYASSSPDKPPFVKVGQQIHRGDVLFIVESMKVMNEVPAEQEGTVAEIMVDNGQPVEYGQPVLRLE